MTAPEGGDKPPATDDPPVADEGESHGDPLTTHSPTGAPPEPRPTEVPSWRKRCANAWQVLRGKDVKYKVVPDAATELDNKRKRQKNFFRGVYAVLLMGVMIAQVGIADYFFFKYVSAVKYDVEPSVVIAFLSSVVVEVIGLVLVVTKALFDDDGDSAR